MDFRTHLKSGRFILFDGGMGSMLQARGLKAGEIPEIWNLEHPEIIRQVHEEYVRAGADVITANTFGANRRKLGDSVQGVIEAAVKLAREADPQYVALDVGPSGAMLRPLGDFEFDDAYALFKEQIIAGTGAGADLIIIETMTDLSEAKAAVLAAKENSDLPVIVSLSYEKSGRTFLGVSAAAAAVTLSGLGADALGVNCSVGPDDLSVVVEQLCSYSSVPVIVQANAGLPSMVDGRTVYSIGAEEYAASVAGLLKKGYKKGSCVQILGGCCGTTPEFISRLNELTLEDAKEDLSYSTGGDGNYRRRKIASEAACLCDEGIYAGRAMVCSSSQVVEYQDKTAVVGERINPTGKKKISAALRNGDYDLITAEAQKECECGAEILDVNAGLADIDEKAVLKELVYRLEGECFAPLQIDTTDPEALEEAVRIYAGKPIINSVNGKADNMAKIMPIAAKYGAALICLTLDENGIPSKAEDRIRIAERIMENAEKYGIPKENIIIDGLVMTVSTNQAEAEQTLKTVRLAREKLGVHTCLGVSNISFGLPEREIMNSVFLAEAFAEGLNLPIIDPTRERYMQTVYSHRVLSGEDISAEKYIGYIPDHPATPATLYGSKGVADGSRVSVNGAMGVANGLNGSVNGAMGAANGSNGSVNGAMGVANGLNGSVDSSKGTTDDSKGAIDGSKQAAGNTSEDRDSVASLVIAGKKGLIEAKVTELLITKDPMDIINNEFIPALDRVGELYEQSRIFLPQLMNSAETARMGFEVIRKVSAASAGPKRMSIVLATVKGDIHDIGKNIVRMLLENYGFDVIDLGKDVDPQIIVDTVLEKDIHLVGLSALMTTTVRSMEETIKQLRAACAGVKIMVGGAVMSSELAKKIGADYYSKDAAESAKIAAQVEAELGRT